MVWASPDSSNFQLGAALYRFVNVEGTPNDTLGSHYYDKTAAQGMQKGNTLMYVNAVGDPVIYGIASKFRELNITAKMDLAAFDPVHVIIAADYVKNLGYKQDEISFRTGLVAPAPKITGRQTSLMVGMPKIRKSGEWQTSIAYKYLERDAVLDALTDSDFHLGGTNAKGFIVGGSYGVDDNTWLSLRWYSTDQIDGAPLSIDMLQIDLNARF
jgi:TPR repeat protein